jgi:hypothetical protein
METTTATHRFDAKEIEELIAHHSGVSNLDQITQELVSDLDRLGSDFRSARRSMSGNSAEIQKVAAKIIEEIECNANPGNAEWLAGPTNRILEAYTEYKFVVKQMQHTMWLLAKTIGCVDADAREEFRSDLNTICFGEFTRP